MPGTQPLTPDDIYCVYCHAMAAGPCAVCGALCCGDCVELVMGLTTRRATCRACMSAGRRPTGATVVRWLALGLGALVAVAMLGLVVAMLGLALA